MGCFENSINPKGFLCFLIIFEGRIIMYKVTLFSEVLPQVLETKLKPIGFKKIKGALVWETKDSIFKIIPFGGEPYRTQEQGYRLFFDGSIGGALHLFDRSIGLFKPRITAVEYLLSEERTREDWALYFASNSKYKTVDNRGIFNKGNVGIVCAVDNLVNLMIRPNKPKGVLSLNKSIEELASLVEEIRPTNYDIFSYAEVI